MNPNKRPNALVNESSPYLLQHAYNPVDWMGWTTHSWEKARSENKLVVVSIGYSACHWCHVMEHESFEDIEVAALMNEYYVSIKVDREERPDVDAVYMEAVQLISGHGGWPLNCICLPDGRPIYGGTYFRKSDWMKILGDIQHIFETNPAKVEEYAQQLFDGLEESERIKIVTGDHAQKVDFKPIIDRFISSFDPEFGGPRKAPKFPMPCSLEFLLNYGIVHQHQAILDHVHLTLTKMAYGGINDQLAGGFARYSVDEQWKVPHFEKMLYDNGQLIGLYAKAFAHFKDPYFLDVVTNTIDFLENDLRSPEGIYFSALDADSEGVEGKFYVWTEEELKSILSEEEFKFFSVYYSINEFGYWEHGNFVLIRKYTEAAVAEAVGSNVDHMRKIVQQANKKLLAVRNKRIRPGLDDKGLLAWNALAIKGIAEAAIFLENPKYKKRAIDLYESVQRHFCSEGNWYRNYKKGKASITAFSEDLALLAESQLILYELTFEEIYLTELKKTIAVLMRDYFEPDNGLFYFTSIQHEKLIVRRTEIFDNVINSPNSVLASVLYRGGMITGEQDWITVASQMVANASVYFDNAPMALSNWLSVYQMIHEVQKEIVVIGPDFKEAMRQLRTDYYPLTVWCGATTETLPLLTSRLINGQTTIYECHNKACKLPTKFNA